jgi:hypothetical protein
MPRFAVASALIAAAALGGTPAAGQDEAPAPPTAEAMIETAREAYRPPGLMERCTPGADGEIVVCAPDPERYRVSSSIEDAIAADQPVPDGLPRAPNVFGIPPCEEMGVCMKIGSAPEPPLIIDLAALPHPLTPEEAANVFRADGEASPAGASPADAP